MAHEENSTKPDDSKSREPILSKCPYCHQELLDKSRFLAQSENNKLSIEEAADALENNRFIFMGYGKRMADRNNTDDENLVKTNDEYYHCMKCLRAIHIGYTQFAK